MTSVPLTFDSKLYTFVADCFLGNVAKFGYLGLC